MVSRAASRRTVLRVFAATGAVMLAGCSGDDEETPTPAPSTSASAGSTPAPVTDEVLLERAQAMLRDLLGSSLGVARSRPSRRLVEALDTLNGRLSARLVALGAPSDVPPARGRTPSAAVAQRRLLAAVLDTQVLLVRIAERAESGDLARLVASVCAGLSQDATVLTTGDTSRGQAAAGAGLTGSLGSDLDERSLDTVQQALAGEHAAVYAYGVMAGRSPTAEAQLARRGYIVHRARRDALTAAVRAAGVDAVVAEPGYALPVDVASSAHSQRVGQQVEDRCSVLYATVVAAAPASALTRRQAVTALGDAAVRLLEWGGEPVALPGVQLP